MNVNNRSARGIILIVILAALLVAQRTDGLVSWAFLTLTAAGLVAFVIYSLRDSKQARSKTNVPSPVKGQNPVEGNHHD